MKTQTSISPRVHHRHLRVVLSAEQLLAGNPLVDGHRVLLHEQDDPPVRVLPQDAFDVPAELAVRKMEELRKLNQKARNVGKKEDKANTDALVVGVNLHVLLEEIGDQSQYVQK